MSGGWQRPGRAVTGGKGDLLLKTWDPRTGNFVFMRITDCFLGSDIQWRTAAGEEMRAAFPAYRVVGWMPLPELVEPMFAETAP